MKWFDFGWFAIYNVYRFGTQETHVPCLHRGATFIACNYQKFAILSVYIKYNIIINVSHFVYCV